MKHSIAAVLEWLGEELDESGGSQVERFGSWLIDEAVAAGGLGPNEGDRVEDRHLADSLSFAAGFDAGPRRVLDVGSGVGLPGIPLAILRRDSHFVLLDRSLRRCDLARRAVRVLGLTNVSVVEGDIADHHDPYDAMVMRATLAPRTVLPHISRLLSSSGAAVIGLTRSHHADGLDELIVAASRRDVVVSIIEVPVLDSPSTLLRMTVA